MLTIMRISPYVAGATFVALGTFAGCGETKETADYPMQVDCEADPSYYDFVGFDELASGLGDAAGLPTIDGVQQQVREYAVELFDGRESRIIQIEIINDLGHAAIDGELLLEYGPGEVLIELDAADLIAGVPTTQGGFEGADIAASLICRSNPELLEA